MSIHINAPEGAIADKILLPGDPLRAKFIAENFLEDAVCFNEVRGMLGYTGTYKGQRISVMGTGMGMPSISIYVNELIKSYGVKKLIRVGTAGSLNKDVHVRELVLAQAAATTSSMIKNEWPSRSSDFEDNLKKESIYRICFQVKRCVCLILHCSSN